jgi:ubiquinone/menaquinone biosynthesis C-methylase UbiE
MNQRDARSLIATAVSGGGRVWADIGAGTGTFTRALRSLLGPDSRIYAVDNDPDAITALEKLGDGVIPVQADFSRAFSLPEKLDGMLLANALHFVPNPGAVLERLAKLIKPGGRVVIVEYDRRAANPWVPHPIESNRWPALATAADLSGAQITSRRRSEYASELYVAVAERR